MLLSYCLPCHKRTKDLLAVMPSVVVSANQSPPVEIIIVDYGDQPSLSPLLEDFQASLRPGNNLFLKTYRKCRDYHMAHARNLSIRAARGDYVVISCADVVLLPHFFSSVRRQLAETGVTYLRSATEGYIGVITCRRQELIALGGYDERFEFYGPEDKDILHRLSRHGAAMGTYDLDSLITLIRTSDEQKTANYRLPLTKKEMSALGRKILEENDAAQLIIANEGLVWGQD